MVVLTQIAIGITVGLFLPSLAFLVVEAWSLGGEFVIKGNYGYRKGILERLSDGFEKIRRM